MLGLGLKGPAIAWQPSSIIKIALVMRSILRGRRGRNACACKTTLTAYEQESKLLKGGYIRDSVGDYYRGQEGGY